MLSKQELYAWASLAFTGALLGFYLIKVWGLPADMAPYGDAIGGIFLKVIGIAFVVELTLDILASLGPKQIEKDERDAAIAAKGYRNAYYFFIAAIISVMAHVVLSDFFQEAGGEEMWVAIPFLTFHALLVVVFVGHLIKVGTQLFYYRTGI